MSGISQIESRRHHQRMVCARPGFAFLPGSNRSALCSSRVEASAWLSREQTYALDEMPYAPLDWRRCICDTLPDVSTRAGKDRHDRVLGAACVVVFVTGTSFRALAWPFLVVSAGEVAIFCVEDPERLRRRVGRADVLQALLGIAAVMAVGVGPATFWS